MIHLKLLISRIFPISFFRKILLMYHSFNTSLEERGGEDHLDDSLIIL